MWAKMRAKFWLKIERKILAEKIGRKIERKKKKMRWNRHSLYY